MDLATGRHGGALAVTLATLALTLTACSDADSGKAGPDRVAAQDAARDHYASVASCLTDRGFPATFNAQDMRLDVAVGPGQDADFDRAQLDCQAVAGPAPTVAPWTDAELSDLYDQSVAAYECLVAEGFAPFEPPTLEKFMVDYRSEGLANPYIPHMSQVRYAEPFPDEKCPQPHLLP